MIETLHLDETKRHKMISLCSETEFCLFLLNSLYPADKVYLFKVGDSLEKGLSFESRYEFGSNR